MLLWAERLPSHRKGQTFALYIALYTAGRFVFENMRSDPAHDIAGLRVNAWVSIVLFVIGVGWFVWLGTTALRIPATRSTRRRGSRSRSRVGD